MVFETRIFDFPSLPEQISRQKESLDPQSTMWSEPREQLSNCAVVLKESSAVPRNMTHNTLMKPLTAPRNQEPSSLQLMIVSKLRRSERRIQGLQHAMDFKNQFRQMRSKIQQLM
jgi:hypothetical protein